MIDNKTLEQARNADIIIFLEKYRGFTFTLKSGAYRCREHPSLAVKSDRRSFYWHSKGIGGFGVLDYLMKIEHIPFREAVETATGITPAQVNPHPSKAQRGTEKETEIKTEKPKTLKLPQRTNTPLRLYDYLCNKRGIDSGIVDRLIQEKKLYEDKRGNIVFVGYDENNAPRFASLRGTYTDKPFRMDCHGSDKQYGFKMNYSQNRRLYIFESPIDCMSHATLVNMQTGDKNAWRGDNRLSLGGTSSVALTAFLERNPQIKRITLHLDNDDAGRTAARIIKEALAADSRFKRIRVSYNPPRGAKDYNAALLRAVSMEKEQKQAHRRKAGIFI